MDARNWSCAGRRQRGFGRWQNAGRLVAERLFVSLVVNTIGAKNVGDAVLVGLVLGWFWVSSSLMLVFFENRSWKWFQISALSHILTAVVLGLVVGLFL